MTNLYTSYRLGLKNTSNAGRTYLTEPFTVPTNFVIKVKKHCNDLQELYSACNKGLVVESFSTPQSADITGHFKLKADPCFIIKKGSIIGISRTVLIRGKIFEFMRHEIIGGGKTEIQGRVSTPYLCFFIQD